MTQQATGIEAKVCADIAARQALGVAKYGVTVQDNPLALQQWLQHAYEECLDQAVYLRRAMQELTEQTAQQDSGLTNRYTAPQPAQQEPVAREHITNGSPCWCEPETNYKDPETGISVIVHKEPQ